MEDKYKCDIIEIKTKIIHKRRNRKGMSTLRLYTPGSNYMFQVLVTLCDESFQTYLTEEELR